MTTEAAYQPGPGSPLVVDREVYGRIGDAASGRELVDSFVILSRSGRAWTVPAGHLARISTPEGPQVGDLNVWYRHIPRERFWAARTRQLHAAHLTTFDRLWSTLPYLSRWATVGGDTFMDYGIDTEGGRVHHLLGTRCDHCANEMLTGEFFDFHCHSNLVRAVAPFGLTELDVNDVINDFQCTGLTDKDHYFMKTCPATAGDYHELFAEIDLLMAFSTCPGGDLSIPMWGDDARDTREACRPLATAYFLDGPHRRPLDNPDTTANGDVEWANATS